MESKLDVVSEMFRQVKGKWIDDLAEWEYAKNGFTITFATKIVKYIGGCWTPNPRDGQVMVKSIISFEKDGRKYWMTVEVEKSSSRIELVGALLKLNAGSLDGKEMKFNNQFEYANTGSNDYFNTDYDDVDLENARRILSMMDYDSLKERECPSSILDLP